MRVVLKNIFCGYITCAKNREPCRLGIVVMLSVFLVCLLLNTTAATQSPVRIGALTASWGPPPQVVGLIEGLVAMGYRENQDFVIGVRFTQGDTLALPAVATEMVQQGVDILFCAGEPEARAAQKATTTHPIVFSAVGDPVKQGLIASYSRPGGNMTGVTDLNLELSGKRLQLFKELLPSLKRVMFPYNANNAHQVARAMRYRTAAQRLGIVLMERKVRTVKEAQDTLARVVKEDIDGIVAPRNTDLNIPGLVLDTAKRHAIPSMFDVAFYLTAGGFASYGPSPFASGRQAARLVDKIIKGAAPGKIPVEVDRSFEFVINLKVAKELGITISREVLFKADRLFR